MHRHPLDGVVARKEKKGSEEVEEGGSCGRRRHVRCGDHDAIERCDREGRTRRCSWAARAATL